MRKSSSASNHVILTVLNIDLHGLAIQASQSPRDKAKSSIACELPLSLAPRNTLSISAVIPASSEFRLKISPHRDPVEHCPYGETRAVSIGWAASPEISHNLLL